jgi:hypothetical protein
VVAGHRAADADGHVHPHRCAGPRGTSLCSGFRRSKVDGATRYLYERRS